MQALQPLPRVGCPGIERGQPQIVADYVTDRRQQPAVGDALLEQRILVDQVGEPRGPLLLVHLLAGLLPFLLGELLEAGDEGSHLGRGQEVREGQIPLLVEEGLLLLRKHAVLHPKAGEGFPNLHGHFRLTPRGLCGHDIHGYISPANGAGSCGRGYPTFFGCFSSAPSQAAAHSS